MPYDSDDIFALLTRSEAPRQERDHGVADRLGNVALRRSRHRYWPPPGRGGLQVRRYALRYSRHLWLWRQPGVWRRRDAARRYPQYCPGPARPDGVGDKGWDHTAGAVQLLPRLPD